MLVLSRKSSESILIGNDVEVIVVSLGGGKVRLGISAPPSVEILRSELAEATRQEAGAVCQEGGTEALLAREGL